MAETSDIKPDNPLGWIRKAESALFMAQSRVKGALPEEYCFHAQQAAEKALKAVYVANDIPFAFIHDLNQLVDDLEKGGVKVPPKIRNVKALEEITRYAVINRYVHDTGPTPYKRRKAIRIAMQTVDWARAEVIRSGKGTPINR